MIQESNKNLDKGNYGSAEFKALEAIQAAKSKLGPHHPLVCLPSGKLPNTALSLDRVPTKLGLAGSLVRPVE